MLKIRFMNYSKKMLGGYCYHFLGIARRDAVFCCCCCCSCAPRFFFVKIVDVSVSVLSVINIQQLSIYDQIRLV